MVTSVCIISKLLHYTFCTWQWFQMRRVLNTDIAIPFTLNYFKLWFRDCGLTSYRRNLTSPTSKSSSSNRNKRLRLRRKQTHRSHIYSLKWGWSCQLQSPQIVSSFCYRSSTDALDETFDRRPRPHYLSNTNRHLQRKKSNIVQHT